MRAGDVRQRRDEDVRLQRLLRRPGARPVGRRRGLGGGRRQRVDVRNVAVAGARRTGHEGRMAGAEPHFGLVPVHRPQERVVVAGFQQQLGRERRGPFRLGDVRRRLPLDDRRLRTDPRAEIAMPPDFVRPVEQRRDAILLAGLAGQAQRKRLHVVVVHGLGAIRVEGAGHVGVRGPVPTRDEKPHTVLHDRSARAVVVIVQLVQLRRDGDAPIDQRLVDVLPLHVLVRIQADEFAVELVPARLRDAVDEHAGRLILGIASADLHGHFLRLRFVVVDTRALAAGKHRVGNHPVDQHARVPGLRPVRQQAAAGPHRARAADVEPAGGDRRHRAGHQHETASGRDRVEQVLAEDFTARAGLHVDDRRLAGHRDRFLDRAHLHLHVERRHEVGFEQDPFARDGVEPAQREGHLVGARTQVHDPVLAGFVRRRRADFLDQRRTAGFDCHARKHGARCVLHHAGDRALRQGDARHADECDTDTQCEKPSTHKPFPPVLLCKKT